MNNSISSTTNFYHKTPALINFKGSKKYDPNQNTNVSNCGKQKDKHPGAIFAVGWLATIISAISLVNRHIPKKVQGLFNSEFKNIKQIKKNLSEIFGKKFTTKEAKELAQKYKKLLDITDDNELVNKLFEQLKIDYGFKNSRIRLDIYDYTRENAPKWRALHPDCGHFIALSRVDGKLPDREKLFVAMFHEFKHHKQFEISIATDTHAYEDAVAHKKIKEYTQADIDEMGGKDAAIEWLKAQGRILMQAEIDRIGREIGQLPKDSPLYRKGLEYIEAHKNYIQESELRTNHDSYTSSLLEIEAKRVSKLAKELFCWLKES